MDSVIQSILNPLGKYYGDEKAVEVRMNKAFNIVTDIRGDGLKLHHDRKLNIGQIKTICKSLANVNGLEFNDDIPKISCRLPEGHRFECLLGPSAEHGISLAIRCKHNFIPSWRQLGIVGNVKKYIEEAIDQSKNIIISGATNTGKTTVLNRLISLLPEDRRVVACEDTAELSLGKFWDGVRLLAARHDGTGSGLLTWRELYDHMMRITPDHIIFGEISTENVYCAMGALNSGVTGFMCTIHAESAEQAINRKFEQNISWSGMNLNNVSNYLKDLIDVVIQIKRDNNGIRKITDMYEPKNNHYVFKNKKWVGKK